MADVIFAGAIYRFIITQSGGSDPSVTVVGDNTLGAIVWTRGGPGFYAGFLSGGFPANKTWCMCMNTVGAGKGVTSMYRINNDNVVIETTRNDVVSSNDSQLVEAAGLIIVFP